MAAERTATPVPTMAASGAAEVNDMAVDMPQSKCLASAERRGPSFRVVVVSWN
jgi:hypothetical protein